MPELAGAIHDKGGNVIAIFEANPTTGGLITATLISGTNCMSLGHIADSTIQQGSNKTDYKNEKGDVVATDFDYDAPTAGTLMQTDAAMINFLAKTTKGKKYIQYKYQGVVNGKHQEYFAYGTVTPMFNITTPGGTNSNKYEFTPIFNTTPITLTATQLVAMETAASITIHTTGATISNGWLLKDTL